MVEECADGGCEAVVVVVVMIAIVGRIYGHPSRGSRRESRHGIWATRSFAPATAREAVGHGTGTGSLLWQWKQNNGRQINVRFA